MSMLGSGRSSMRMALLLAAGILAGCTTPQAPTPATASSQECPSLGSSPVAARIAAVVRSGQGLAASELRAQLQTATRDEQLRRTVECFQRRAALTRTSRPPASAPTTEHSR